MADGRGRRALIGSLIVAIAGLVAVQGAPPASAAPMSRAFVDFEGSTAPVVLASITGGLDQFQPDVLLFTSQTQPGQFRSLRFAPVSGQPFTAGTYENAQRADFRAAGHPGIDVTLDGSGCNTVFGRFIVDEISLDANGAPLVFAARFEYHCEQATVPPTFGAIVFNSSAPYRERTLSAASLSFASSPIGGTSPAQQLTVTNSGPSDLTMGTASIEGVNASSFGLTGGNCVDQVLGVGDSCSFDVAFTPHLTGGAHSAQLVFFDDDAPPGGAGRRVQLSGQATAAFLDAEPGNPMFPDGAQSALSVVSGTGTPAGVHLTAGGVTMNLAPPVGQSLAQGTYDNALFTADATHPGITMTFNVGSPCSAASTGRFVVDQIQFDGANNLQAALVRSEYHCSGLDTAIYAVMSFNDAHSFTTRTISPPTVAFATQTVGTTSGVQQVTVTNTGPASLTTTNVSIAGPDAAQFEVADESCTGSAHAVATTCTFDVQFAPTGDGGPRTAKLTFFDGLAPIGGTGRDVVLTGTASQPQGEFTPLTPARILDTRTGVGVGGTPAKVGPGKSISLDVTGHDGLPTDQVAAVVMNVTATGTVMPAVGYVTVYPDDAGAGCPAPPTASNLNFAPGETRPNLVTVKVGANGNVCLFNGVGSIDLIADVSGYYADTAGTAGSRFHGITPTRRIDTRFGTGAPVSKVGPGGQLTLDVRGDGVPQAGVTAVVLNVTVTSPTPASYGWLTAYPGDIASPPTASNLNFSPGQTVPNLVIVRVPSSGPQTGIIKLANGDFGSTDVIADVVGYYDQDRSTEAGRFFAVDPQRIFDTRTDFDGSPLPPNFGVQVEFGEGVSAVVTNVTITGPSAFGWLTAFPADEDIPLASNLNWVPGLTVPNLVMVKAGGPGPPPGAVFYANGDNGVVHVICDWNGFFTDAGFSASSPGLRVAGSAPGVPRPSARVVPLGE